eukprot:CAMPEP_0113694974 /NCGR_PEP_ID=MMETSP0038_2-20120614/20615_1 /TAXON_ID=2898 /ORGANISM="Cryptomonas paramecium" /LENGTH=175 /DNA_ID=CAMNT_0000617411 /DNA_START=913 /DNA_END=1439 /DNA_ORIENTATION=+ /assembly_acc=CAM_ASM_000170
MAVDQRGVLLSPRLAHIRPRRGGDIAVRKLEVQRSNAKSTTGGGGCAATTAAADPPAAGLDAAVIVLGFTTAGAGWSEAAAGRLPPSDTKTVLGVDGSTADTEILSVGNGAASHGTLADNAKAESAAGAATAGTAAAVAGAAAAATRPVVAPEGSGTGPPHAPSTATRTAPASLA